MAARQLKEAEHGQEAQAGVAGKLTDKLESALTALILAGCAVELLIAISRRGLIDHRARGLEGLIVDVFEPLDRGEPRFNCAQPQPGEALGVECSTSRVVQ